MHDLLARIWARGQFTTVLITHDVVEAVTLADRVLVLKDGGWRSTCRSRPGGRGERTTLRPRPGAAGARRRVVQAPRRSRS